MESLSSLMAVPFNERGGRLRGGIDLLAGRLPSFVFGGAVGRMLPVFHFHDEAPADLEPKLRYLSDNRYRTVTADEIAGYVRDGRAIPERAVALCFDDAWASLWTDGGPLLKRYGFCAIVYVIPGRTEDAALVRPRQAVAGAGTSPFMTWPELRALHAEGTLDVQSHTFSHAMIDTSAQPAAFVDPRYGESSSFLARPLIDDGLDEVPRRRPRFVTPADLGAPLYRTRSRMSDAPRILHAPAVREACLDLVRSEGGEAFFSTRRWHARLTDIAGHANAGHRTESDDEHQRHIERELEDARTEIDHQIGARVVRHVCLPWGVSGRRTEAALKRLGFSTAIANRMPGTFAVRPGDDPFWLKRLPNRYIFRLPGHGRRWPFAARS